MGDVFNILVLCTHNSARSILTEAMINHWAAKLNKPVRAFSAGSAASGRVNPLALECLQAVNVATDYLRSKSWDEFTLPNTPIMNAVITVCDSAASEQCPIWPGAPVQVHWGYADPSASEGNHQHRLAAFELTRQALKKH
jgi:arsenate reductase (thioredoxin)